MRMYVLCLIMLPGHMEMMQLSYLKTDLPDAGVLRSTEIYRIKS